MAAPGNPGVFYYFAIITKIPLILAVAIPAVRISLSAAVAATVHPVVTAQPLGCRSRRAKFQQSLRNAGHMRICE